MSEEKPSFFHIHPTDDPSASLRGRQSVRTTFKLSERCIEALSILALQMGIKQKSLFDHLVEELPSAEMAGRAPAAPEDIRRRVAKTYVISRRTLESLEKVSVLYNIPRDSLVEFCIERVVPLIAQEKQKHAKRKLLLDRLHDQHIRNNQLLAEAERLLEPSDPVFQAVIEMVHANEISLQRIAGYIERSRRIEEF